MTDEQAWEAERHFWTGREAWYQRRLDPHCIMVFPPPAGMLDAAGALAGIRAAPRWRSVRFEGQRLARPGPDLCVLAYHARANRDGAPAYAALCSSSYRREGDEWLLFQHQQTPALDLP
jgi:hypothetical protein